MEQKSNWILLIMLSFFLLNCQKKEETPNIIPIEFESNRDKFRKQTECFTKTNDKLVGLLGDTTALMRHLSLSKEEAIVIVQSDNQSKCNKADELLIQKLMTQIADSTILEVFCVSPRFTRLSVGSLALLSIYQIERFPFAAALRAQWCTGRPITENIILPNDITAYVSYRPNGIRCSFEEYFNGQERQLYWAE